MKRIGIFLVTLLALLFFWNNYKQEIKTSNYMAVYNDLKQEINSIMESPQISSAIDSFNDGVNHLLTKINISDDFFSHQDQTKSVQVKKPDLTTPQSTDISIHNIELGDSKNDIEMKIGKAKRATYNEYGVKWYAYHTNYQNFFLIAYDQTGKVSGLYTNQDLISSKLGIKWGSTKSQVVRKLGEPETQIKKGFVYYQLQNNGEFQLFHLNNCFITVFYDKHQHNTVTAVQIISEQLERQKKKFYTKANDQLKEGFELQLFDLTNAERVEHDLPALIWDENVKETAQSHSADMAKNNYFSHTNLEGQSPFDRMEEDHITFRVAGENLASGQMSSIFAHEGLMNSLGHRENILHSDFRELGVGVAFDSESKPYFTENFVTK